VTERIKNGGRLFYIGTGTSGRLGVLDASECPPTFGVKAELVQAVIAGGYDACYRAVEASEDDIEKGEQDLSERGFKSSDALIGIAASGRTPYTIGALKWARSIGAFTACITCSPGSPIADCCDVSLVAAVGPEVITGSTRLKAGTAQKMILNMISTASMVRLGFVSGNRMTNLQTRNKKLRDRAIRVMASETGLDFESAQQVLSNAGGDLRIALVMYKTGRQPEVAREALNSNNWVVKKAIEALVAQG
ncbi:MAG: N-acetylmuramic acid 6-phosphate etherase, partial [Pyrinomonadaceae bacterium]